MTISFNNIPTTVRTPGVYNEIDNSRALQGLVQNPHKALIIGQRIAAGSVAADTLTAVTRDNLADGFFGPGSILARMCNFFKENNPNTELWAVAVSDNAAGTTASGRITFSGGISATTTATLNLMINGTQVPVIMTSGWSCTDMVSAIKGTINTTTYSALPVVASVTGSNVAIFSAVNNGEAGNYIDFRLNYYEGQSTIGVGTPTLSGMEGGANNPDIDDVWSIIDNEQFHYIIQPWIDSSNLTKLENELADRFLPLEDKQGHAFTGLRATQASCTTLGNTRNSPHNTIIGANDSPTDPIEWAASLGAVAAFNLNIDPARPLHYLQLKDVLPPPTQSRFTRAESDILLYDGIATWIVDAGGRAVIERCITTYQTNVLGLPDPSYLDIQTLATLSEIRFQYKTRMQNRFLIPRFKLADDTFNVQPGSKVATPKTVKGEILALFNELSDIGLVENLDDFETNLIVERNTTDVNRVDVLLPPDLINQFRILASLVQFIL